MSDVAFYLALLLSCVLFAAAVTIWYAHFMKGGE